MRSDSSNRPSPSRPGTLPRKSVRGCVRRRHGESNSRSRPAKVRATLPRTPLRGKNCSASNEALDTVDRIRHTGGERRSTHFAQTCSVSPMRRSRSGPACTEGIRSSNDPRAQRVMCARSAFAAAVQDSTHVEPIGCATEGLDRPIEPSGPLGTIPAREGGPTAERSSPLHGPFVALRLVCLVLIVISSPAGSRVPRRPRRAAVPACGRRAARPIRSRARRPTNSDHR